MVRQNLIGGYEKQNFGNLAELQKGLMNLDRAMSKPVFVDNKQYNDYQCVYNVDRKTPAMITSKHYKIVQHREVFDNFVEAMKELGLQGAGHVWNNGNQVITQITFKGKGILDPSAGHIPGDNKTQKTIGFGVRLTNSYDKSMSIKGNFFAFRGACSNGMLFGQEMREINVHQKHVGQIDIVKTMEDFLKGILGCEEQLQEIVSETMKDTMEWQVAYKVMEKLFAQPKHREEVFKRLGVSQIWKEDDKKTKAGHYEYVADDPTKVGKKVTRWQLYNALTNYVTHGDKMTPHVQEWLHAKGSKLLLPNKELLAMVGA